MKEIDREATDKLLAVLDNDINVKCMELKEKQREARQKRIFFISCITIVLIFFLQMFFSIFNVNYLLTIVIYEIAAMMLIVPLILKVYLGGVIK